MLYFSFDVLHEWASVKGLWSKHAFNSKHVTECFQQRNGASECYRVNEIARRILNFERRRRSSNDASF